MKTEIWVYAHWIGMENPECIGILSAQQEKTRKTFSFRYDTQWLKSKKPIVLDPDISWFSGQQFPFKKENFGVFSDSMPDTWGRTLMKRREFQLAKQNNTQPKNLFDIDFLLGVFDETRMGAMRFKTDPDAAFLDANASMPTPPWARIRELQHAAKMFENDNTTDGINEWLNILIAPGSSLGGARPKANVATEDGQLWIAKFPSKADDIDKAQWEFLAYQLALSAGIQMSESKLEHIADRYQTFFTKRFDRHFKSRIHFASGMTMTGKSEESLRDAPGSYLDLVDFIDRNGAQPDLDLAQLWRRLLFNIMISNTDDHLRNHGFLLSEKGWILSPAFDINPSVDKKGLALNIDTTNNDLEIELAMKVGEYFRLNKTQMDSIYLEVGSAVRNWKKIASSIGISRKDQELMGGAFRVQTR